MKVGGGMRVREVGEVRREEIRYCDKGEQKRKDIDGRINKIYNFFY